jgi:hypothetical protein
MFCQESVGSEGLNTMKDNKVAIKYVSYWDELLG